MLYQKWQSYEWYNLYWLMSLRNLCKNFPIYLFSVITPCGATVTQNLSYLIQDVTTNPGLISCPYTICPISKAVNRIRLDLEVSILHHLYMNHYVQKMSEIQTVWTSGIALRVTVSSSCIWQSFVVLQPNRLQLILDWKKFLYPRFQWNIFYIPMFRNLPLLVPCHTQIKQEQQLIL